ncbi:MAG TPA: hypothetical protein VHG70_15000 [Nocardioidaceae bacterium]|nr:hypothetical protein [Nocardioidaceae bacterium]
MSNVVSPRGPLPPRVYWRRRLLLVVVVVGVVVLVTQVLGGGDDTEPVADRGRATPDPAAEQKPSTAAPEPAGQRRQARDRQPARRTESAEPTASLSGPTGPLAQPVGPCQPSAVSIVPDVEDTAASAPVPLRLGLSTSGAQACTFEFGPDSVALRVTSGDDLIWESLKCPSAIEEQSVVVRPGWLGYVEIDWSGRRASEGCAQTGDFAAPGYYWAEAAALGGEPQRSQFELETPPKPKPKPKPEPKKNAKPTDEQQQKPDRRREAQGEEKQGQDDEPAR